MKKNPNRIEFTVNSAFKNQVRLLAAKWGVKTNVAIQRAVDLALTRQTPNEEKALLKSVSSRLDLIVDLLLPE